MYLCSRKKAGSRVAVSKCSLKIPSMYLCSRKKAGSRVAVSKCSMTLGGRLNFPWGQTDVREGCELHYAGRHSIEHLGCRAKLDNISQMVNTSIVHDINVRSIGCSDVSMCDSIPDT